MTETHQPAGLTPEAPSRPAPNKWALIGVAALLVVLTNAVVFVLPPLLPVIQAQYHLATVADTTWVYSVLTLGGGAGFILLPRLADVHGDRNTSVVAAAFLTVGALVPAIGDSYPTLLVGCALMGFGGAAQLLPLGFLRRNLGESGITVGVAVLVIATGVGIVVGMIGGGFIVENLSLRSFFVVLTAACAATTLASYVTIPHAPPAERTRRIGVLGTVWMIAWVAAILLTLTQGLLWGTAALVPLAAGVIGGIAWVRVERTSSSAVFDVAMMKAPLVTASCVCIALFAAVNAAFMLLLSTYAQIAPAALRPADAYGLGLSELNTALVMAPFAAAFLVRGTVLDRALFKGRGVSVFVAGALISAAGLAWLAVAHDRPWHYLVGSAVMGLGCRIGYTAGFTLVQLAVPEEKAGMAAGAAGTFMAVGFALGTALVSGDLSASLVPVSGTDLEVAAEGLYGIGYWLAVILALLVAVTALISRARSNRRAEGAVS
ncbi:MULTISPECIES: MFS transporter [Streptomyces]|jgi:MFS family permease|uniref:MFS family permease n=1 Tax=Streptomyces nymphaeiformis TaxID=2663842 RepID=A0A7W7XBZ0_9ACTN|nr:MFS transporter [Streptomyces nymphaeiformis]MBB4981678.1 MFS family permease [Streptomyces nymphaeiformis]